MNRFKSYKSGFTIIEVMLFLAISGALAAGILASSSVAINSQRYRDATNTLQASLQKQYNQTAHVVNERNGPTERCNATGVATSLQNGGEPRGSSECLVMGRYIAIQNSGAITLSNVIGYKARSATVTTETGELQNYDFFLDSSTTESDEVAWGGTLTFKDSANRTIAVNDNDQAFTLLVLRSPLTGVTRTFTYVGKKNVTEINGVSIAAATAQDSYKICVDPALFTVGTSLGILVHARASSAGAIELLTGDTAC